MDPIIENSSAEGTAAAGSEIASIDMTDTAGATDIGNVDEAAKAADAAKAAGTDEKKPFIKGLTYTNEEELLKGFSEKDLTINKLNEKVAAADKAKAKAEALLESTTGIKDPLQIDVYNEQQKVESDYRLKEINILRNYFDIPHDKAGALEAYNKILADKDGHMEKLTVTAALELNNSIMRMGKEKETAYESVKTKYGEYTNNLNARNQTQLDATIDELTAGKPESLNAGIKEALGKMMKDYNNAGMNVNPSIFKETAEYFIKRDEGIYNAGLEAGKKGAAIDKHAAKLNGGAGGGGETPQPKVNKNIDFDSYNKLSATEKSQFYKLAR